MALEEESPHVAFQKCIRKFWCGRLLEESSMLESERKSLFPPPVRGSISVRCATRYALFSVIFVDSTRSGLAKLPVAHRESTVRYPERPAEIPSSTEAGGACTDQLLPELNEVAADSRFPVTRLPKLDRYRWTKASSSCGRQNAAFIQACRTHWPAGLQSLAIKSNSSVSIVSVQSSK
jgi:hypothetical protein